MTKQQLRQYLVDEAEYPEDYVNEMDGYDLVEMWLHYNGIIGYAEDIIDVVKAAGA